MDAATKHCNDCDRDLPLDAFKKGRDKVGRYHKCRECDRRYWKEWRKQPHAKAIMLVNQRKFAARNPERFRDYIKRTNLTDPEKLVRRNRRQNLKRCFGITPEHYDAMYDAQRGLCAICGEQKNRAPNEKRMSVLVVDHDHDTGSIRGLLCTGCNSGIGMLKESEERLQKSILYLRRHKAVELAS